MKKIFLSFLLVITLVCNSGISVHAFSIQEVANDLYLSKVHTDNTIRFLLEDIGIILSPSRWGSGALYDRYQEYLVEKALIIDSDSYEDYLKAHLTVTEDENGESIIIADNDMIDTLYDFSKELINDKPWTNMYTVSVAETLNLFKTKQAYDKFCEIAKSLSSDEVILLEMAWDSVWHQQEQYYDYFYHYRVVNCDGLVKYQQNTSAWYYVIPYYQWERSYNLSDVMTIDDKGNVDTYYNMMGKNYSNSRTFYNIKSYNFPATYSGGSNQMYVIVENVSHCHRVYDSLEDLKQYSVGQRPYYITNEYNNYDSSVNNSTTITQTTIDNSVAYGDVYNYITNNYENPDSLTEEQLRDILEDYLEELKNNQNNDSGGGSGGSDSGSDDSGGGLGGLLSGLGGLGDAILAILGKLIEYVGKALELLSGTVTKVIDIIPSNITALLSGLFPFIPEEWLTIIELSLVLGVILGIVGMFKK